MSSLNIASNALTTNMAALQVIGHNIANVNTPGFSRQT
ncbi:MAG TPA: flagellar basal body protein, partial [Macromonas sp.]|nr:flagellar basal body protein [Macromonas sp.]